MSDSFTHVTSQSWFSRIGDSIKGIFFGLILFVAAFPFLFWNEGRAIETEKSLEEGAAAVVSIQAQAVIPANEGKLVHLTDLATTSEQLQDVQFNIKVQAISLLRTVQVYQWKESSESKTEKEMGGSTKTTTTYNYSKVWSSRLVSSSSFRHEEGHKNPTHMPYQGNSWYAGSVTMGDFSLNPALIREINNSQRIVLSDKNLPENSNAVLVDGEVYIGTPESPQIGDVRINFSEVKPQLVSIVAAQYGNSFTSFITSYGQSIQLLTTGTVSAVEMFKSELSKNTLLTWGLRFLGFILMVIGLSLILRPLSVLGDVVPFIGNILEIGTGLVSGIISFILTLLTIAIAWIFYRPIVAIVLISVVIGTLYYLKRKVKTKKLENVEMAGVSSVGKPPPPPPG